MAKKSLGVFTVTTIILLFIIPLIIKQHNDTYKNMPATSLEQASQSQEALASTTATAISKNAPTKKSREEKTTQALKPKTTQYHYKQTCTPPQKPTPQPCSPRNTKQQTQTKNMANKVSTMPKKTSKKQKTRTITIKNGITKAMLGYSYFGTYYPNKFTITANGTPLVSLDKSSFRNIKHKHEIVQNNYVNTEITDNTLIITFDFEFLDGRKAGTREVTFTIAPEIESLTLTFNWKHDDWHVILDTEKAKPV